MTAERRVLALVPARGGSVRFPRKNLAELAGCPLVALAIADGWRLPGSIEVAVSTEDAEIAAIAEAHGAVVVHRPADLARAETDMIDVIRHAVTVIPADIVLLVQPTSPLRTPADLIATLDPVLRDETPAAFTTWPSGAANGAAYAWTRAQIETGDLWPPDAVKIPMPALRSIDVDYPEDLDLARELLKCRCE